MGEGALRFSLLGSAIALIATGVLLALASRLLADRVRRAGDVSDSMKVVTITAFQAVRFGMALRLGLDGVGFDLTAFAVLSGAAGLGLAFGMRKGVSILDAGLAVLPGKSIEPGDVVSVGDTFGWVGALNARHVSVAARDEREFLAPDQDLPSHQVVIGSHSDDPARVEAELSGPRRTTPTLSPASRGGPARHELGAPAFRDADPRMEGPVAR